MSRFEDTLQAIEPVSLDPDGSIQARLDSLTKPQGSLGRLEALARWYVGIRAGGFADPAACPRPAKKTVFVMVGDHGVAAQGVSAFPQEVTPQMVLNFLGGGAGINVLARHVGARVVVVDCGVAGDLPADEGLLSRKVARGTADFTQGPAMSREQAVAAVEIGIACVEDALAGDGLDLIATGDMGIANTTPSTAMLAAFSGLSVEAITGRGTGIDDEGLARKQRAVEAGLARNAPDPADPLDVLAKVGGFEIGAIAGLCLAGARHRIPVVVDGFISTAGALLASRLAPAARDVMASAHQSQEIGHQAMLKELGLRPLLDLDFRLGEGTGAVLGMGLVDAGVKILCEMATFADAGVSESGD